MKKLLLLAILAGVGYLVFRQVTANQSDDDLWSEVGADQDLRYHSARTEHRFGAIDTQPAT